MRSGEYAHINGRGIKEQIPEISCFKNTEEKTIRGHQRGQRSLREEERIYTKTIMTVF